MTRDEAKAMLLDLLVSLKLLTAVERTGADAKDISFGELGIDSLTIVDLCVGVEEKIGRELRVEEVIDHPTVDLLAAHLSVAR